MADERLGRLLNNAFEWAELRDKEYPDSDNGIEDDDRWEAYLEDKDRFAYEALELSLELLGPDGAPRPKTLGDIIAEYKNSDDPAERDLAEMLSATVDTWRLGNE